jgi:methylglutaconyl-CoA hydratase
MKAFETIRLERSAAGVARLVLARPEAHNAMSIQLIREMRAALAAIEADAGVRVVVLASEGPSFCAGGDLKWMKTIRLQSRAERVAESGELAKMLFELNQLSKVVVGRIQGPAYGGGLGLVACCDVAIAVTTARFALTEVTLGLVPANIAPYVARKLGEANARRVFLHGKAFDAGEARRMGLVAEVVDPDALDAAVAAEIAQTLRCPPLAVAATKKLVDFVLRHSDAENMVYTAECLADAWERDEAAEGIAAFVEKRTPSWRASRTP